MQAAHGALIGREGMVVLNKRDVDPNCGERRLRLGLRENPAVIAMPLWPENFHIGNG